VIETMSAPTFKLSDPGSTLIHDPTMAEYLRCYDFPQPPAARYGFFRLDSAQERDRIALFGQAWVPDHAVGTVLLIHGYCEHAGNYSKLINDLIHEKYAVMTLDLRGHGLSEGPRGHLEQENFYAEDIEKFVNEIYPQLLPYRPLYIWGHSLGALVGLQVLLREKLPVKPSAVVFTSPLLGFPELSGKNKFLSKLAPLISAIFPTLPIPHGISPEILSHDEEYLGRRLEDPLMGKLTSPKWFISAKMAVNTLQDHAKDFFAKSPTLLLLAGDEKVTNLDGARRFAFQAYASMKHKVIEFPGYYHELEKETGIRPRVISETIAWFRAHH
jgi:alpha-beta hydrolase superfamily lysophospholipase